MRLLVVTGCGSRPKELLFDALNQLEERFGSLRLNTPQKNPGPLLEWATVHRAQLSWRWGYAHSGVDAVLTVGGGTAAAVALRYAWTKRIPAVRVHLDGSWIEVGTGWARLLAKHPLKSERAR